MTPEQFIFLVEHITTPEERGFLQALRDHPNDKEELGVYADWLEERGMVESAKRVREGYDPSRGMTKPLPPQQGWPGGAVFSGMISSGSVSTYHVASGTIRIGAVHIASGGLMSGAISPSPTGLQVGNPVKLSKGGVLSKENL